MSTDTEELIQILEQHRQWKEKVLPYLVDFIKLQELVGNHSYVAPLKILIEKK